MDIFELNQILEIKNIKRIEQQLLKLGYFDLSTHPTLKHTSLVDIVQNGYQKAHKEIENGPTAFTGSVYISVPSVPNLEIVWIEYLRAKNGIKARITQSMLLYAKETNANV